MSPLGWVLLAGCCATVGVLGWLVRGLVDETRDFRREQERDDQWDREHGVEPRQVTR